MNTTPAPLVDPKILNRISWLLWAIVLVLLLAFCFIASSLCITLLLAAFLSILIDPLVTYLERFRVPRPASAGLAVVVGMVLCGYLAYASYNRVSDLVETMPEYADQIRSVIAPLDQKIAKVRETAGSLNPDTSKKKIAEVKINEPPSWPGYLVRGVGTIWGAVIIVAVVPFLTFFNLIRKKQMDQRMTSCFGGVIDVPQFVDRVTRMVRAFALGNLMIGSAMSAVTIFMLLELKIQGAVILGIASGFLNLVPFLGFILASIVPIAAAMLQYAPASAFVIILLTVVCLHIVSANYLVPKVIGSRVDIGPVAATVGILFWGWLWGPIGILLAVPLTALVKLVAESHPSMTHVSNLLAESPILVSPWARSQRTIVYGDEDPEITDSVSAKIKL